MRYINSRLTYNYLFTYLLIYCGPPKQISAGLSLLKALNIWPPTLYSPATVKLIVLGLA